MSTIKIEDHSDEVLAELHNRIPVILKALGIEAEGNAIKEITDIKAVDTGRLRNSITFVTKDAQGSPNGQPGEKAKPEDYAPHGSVASGEIYIGTNVEYAPYVELGTSRMAARPFLRNAISNYGEDYKRIIEEGLK